MSLGIKVAYRASSQFPLLFVMNEARLWEKVGLEVELVHIRKSSEAEEALLNREVDFVFGNHVRPYRDRAYKAPVVYLAQTVNWAMDRLVTVPRIRELADLKGGTIGVDRLDSHPTLTVKMYLERGGLADMEAAGIRLVADAAYHDQAEKIAAVAGGKIDAAFVHPPFDLVALDRGLNVLPLPRIAMIWGITVTTTLPTVAEKTEATEALLKALALGVHFFKTRREETLEILEREVAPRLHLEDSKLIGHLYEQLVEILEPSLYPHLEAIQNVYRVALKEYPEAEKVNPLSLWDLHFLRQLEDSGFMDTLCAG